MMLPPPVAEAFHRFLDGQIDAQHVCVEMPMKFGFGDRFERSEFIDSRVIHQDVELAVCGVRLSEESRDVARRCDVALNRDSISVSTCDSRHSTKPIAIAAPMPFEAPVTAATFPSSTPIALSIIRRMLLLLGEILVRHHEIKLFVARQVRNVGLPVGAVTIVVCEIFIVGSDDHDVWPTWYVWSAACEVRD
jgi:hypothetical protein